MKCLAFYFAILFSNILSDASNTISSKWILEWDSSEPLRGDYISFTTIKVQTTYLRLFFPELDNLLSSSLFLNLGEILPNSNLYSLKCTSDKVAKCRASAKVMRKDARILKLQSQKLIPLEARGFFDNLEDPL